LSVHYRAWRGFCMMPIKDRLTLLIDSVKQ
jgi:hypothetical protein